MCEIAEPIYEVERSKKFTKWYRALKNHDAKTQIRARIHRVRRGDFGDCKAVGGGVSEMRIHCGGGYRVYFTIKGQKVIVLLLGGGKNTQQSDIKKAIKAAEEN